MNFSLKKLTLITLLIILLWIVYHNLTKEKMVDNGVRGNGVEQFEILKIEERQK